MIRYLRFIFVLLHAIFHQVGLGRRRGRWLGPGLRLHVPPSIAVSKGDTPGLRHLGDAPARPPPQERHGGRGDVRCHSQPRVSPALRPALHGRHRAPVRPLRLIPRLRCRSLPRLLQSFQPKGKRPKYFRIYEIFN